MLKAARTIVAFGFCVLLSSALAQGLQREPLLAPPAGSSPERLGDSMVVNGRPMAIDHLTSPMTPADVLRHYKNALAGSRGGKVVESSIAGDQVLASRIGENFLTVRVRSTPDGSSDVWVVSTPMQPPPSQKSLPSHLALPAGSQVLSNVETIDGARRAHTVIATVGTGVSAGEDFLKRSLAGQGFALLASDKSGDDPSRRVLIFQRGAEDVMITISEGPAGRTMVLNATGPK